MCLHNMELFLIKTIGFEEDVIRNAYFSYIM